ncbi:MAG: 4-hydroxybenzoate octaprenyltransferase [Beijerinckiaceae bacterium]|nr:4-hydroxybenzoate octaprenyltransferase [Beijerinckiaceae bacterium]
MQTGGATLPDAAKFNIVDHLAPMAWRPYLRLARIDRPIGWWLLLLPCWWSVALASIATQRAPDLVLLVLFMIGAIAMRGAGSTYNDIVDRDLDAQVERTRFRPLPSGAVSAKQAAIFVGFQALIGLAVLLQFNRFAIILGFCSLIPVFIYPFMKRITSWPQAVLGLAFAWGGLEGWAAVTGGLTAPAFLCYAAAIVWTIGYDTIYAVQDLEDDSIVGIRSTARLFGGNTARAVGLLYVATIAFLVPALWMVGAGVAGWMGLIGFAAHLVWQVRKIDTRDVQGALRLFRSNRNAGLILFAGLALDAALRAI